MRALAALLAIVLLAGCRPGIPPVGPVTGPGVPVAHLQDQTIRSGATVGTEDWAIYPKGQVYGRRDSGTPTPEMHLPDGAGSIATLLQALRVSGVTALKPGRYGTPQHDGVTTFLTIWLDGESYVFDLRGPDVPPELAQAHMLVREAIASAR